MNRNSLPHPSRTLAPACLLALVFTGLAGAPRPAAAQPAEKEEIAHAFFTHEGLPDAVGSYSLRTSGLATRADGATKGDFAVHLETGVTENIGLHIRSDQFLQARRSELMFQFVAWKSQDGKSGFAPIIEFEIPTRSGGGKPATLVGFTSKFENSRVALNQALHYNPEAKSVDASASAVLRATERIYPVVELLGMGARGEPTVVNLLAGVKFRMPGGMLLGVAFQRPVTSARELTSQFVVQLEFMLGTPAH
jgi:hypothetical protein